MSLLNISTTLHNYTLLCVGLSQKSPLIHWSLGLLLNMYFCYSKIVLVLHGMSDINRKEPSWCRFMASKKSRQLYWTANTRPSNAQNRANWKSEKNQLLKMWTCSLAACLLSSSLRIFSCSSNLFLSSRSLCCCCWRRTESHEGSHKELWVLYKVLKNVSKQKS